MVLGSYATAAVKILDRKSIFRENAKHAEDALKICPKWIAGLKES